MRLGKDGMVSTKHSRYSMGLSQCHCHYNNVCYAGKGSAQDAREEQRCMQECKRILMLA
jgi:hypothetical protein